MRILRHSIVHNNGMLPASQHAAPRSLRISLAATLVQWVLERETLLNARMASANILLGAVVLIAAGIYQWTPIKNACLAQCQTPFRFLMSHGGFRSNVLGCLHLGLLHGTYCVGCCWVLMALLFVVGVMNVLWIAFLALLVLLEKLTPWGRWVARIAGAVCIAAGAWMVFSSWHGLASAALLLGVSARAIHWS